MDFSSLTTGLICLLATIWFVFRSRYHRTPPGPIAFPIVGSLFSLRPPLHQHFARLSKRYGPILYLKIGTIPYLVINTAKAAEQVLKFHDVEFADRPDRGFLKYISLGWKDLFLQPYGKKWRKMRRISTMHLFSTKMLNSSSTFRSSEIQIALKRIHELCAGGKLVDLRQVSGELIASSLSLTLFGKRDLRFVDIIDQIADLTLALNIGELFPALDWLDLQGVNRRMGTQIMPRLKSIISHHVEEHEREKSEAGDAFICRDFTDVLISLNGEEKLDEISVIALLVDMIAAGLETTKGAVEWAMAELISNPQAMHKAQEELDKVLGKNHRAVQETDLENLPYIDAIMKETLRLHPPAPMGIPHQNRNPVSLSGYVVPARCRVMINLWAVGRDESHWSNPDKFDPERFVNADLTPTGQHFQFIPFSAGRRICAGLPWATRFVALILASFLYEFEWSVPLGQSSISLQEAQGSLTTKIADKLMVCASPRSGLFLNECCAEREAE